MWAAYFAFCSCLGLADSRSFQRVTLAAVVARLAADGTGACFASLATLEVDTGINERTIRRNLEALASADIIEPACRGWKLTENFRAELFPKSVLCTTPDILPSVVDKMSDRRESFDLSPSERISPNGGNSEKPGWIPVSIGAWRKLTKLAREAGHKLIVVAEYAKQYIANLDAKRAYGYLLKLLGQDKDYAWMAGDAYKSGGKAGGEASKRDTLLDAVRGKVLVDPKGNRYELVGSVAACLNARMSIAGKALIDMLENMTLRVLA